MNGTGVSAKSRKVARNTALLYFRMLLLMLIGLFTSRVILKTLGVSQYGIYTAVYSAVMMFTVLSNSIGNSISRFLAYELGRGRGLEKMEKLFSSIIAITAGLCILLFVLAETLGLWYLNNRLEIPAGRETAAFWVFQTSIVLLAIQLFSIPFNSTIIAHEDMRAFAWISILEGVLKLCVALILFLTSLDRLIVYSVLMVLVAAVVRSTYAAFCRKRYEETRCLTRPDGQMVKDMLSFGAWSFTAHGVGVFNTYGINILTNNVFGADIVAVRGIAGQVENIIRQFVTNFLTALNPSITKTWAEGNKDYCFSLVRKGCKLCFLIVLMFAIPFVFESDFILDLWLDEVPPLAGKFTSLAIICVMVDYMSNSLAQLIISEGRVAKYYLITSVISAFTFIGSIMAFSRGAAAETAYYISMAVLTISAAVRLAISCRQCGFPIGLFLREVLIPVVLVTLLSSASSLAVLKFVPLSGTIQALTVIACGAISVCFFTYFLGLTDGEKSYINQSIRKVLNLK